MTDPDTNIATAVERQLAAFLDHAAEPVRDIGPFSEALDALTRFVLDGGKRLRPTFAWWAWRGAGGAATGDDAMGALQAVSALELLQACALIHDDLMDASDSRRGAATVHVAFAKQHAARGWHGDAERFGLAASVLIGDVALAWADDMYSSAALPAPALAAARPIWRAMRTEVLAGQYLDVHTQAVGDSSPEAALRVNELKTAAYTVVRPLQLGAALAGADEVLLAALRRFGHDIGVAFQLRDDLLGVFGDPAITGKPAGDDLREGKRTLLVALGMERAREAGRHADERAIATAVGDALLSDIQLDAARDALHAVGAVDAVEERIAQLTETALTTLRATSLTDNAREELTRLAYAATKRSS
ncbi:polyprenyl synthetase family protein [Haloechinothrix salitolerans]|uniref:Polyprenyl synthetase family protein n=1 Tax=Haloechinothrix salitolerans TaxID=926830 RepID=A0ABW2C2T4_9PSEU